MKRKWRSIRQNERTSSMSHLQLPLEITGRRVFPFWKMSQICRKVRKYKKARHKYENKRVVASPHRQPWPRNEVICGWKLFSKAAKVSFNVLFFSSSDLFFSFESVWHDLMGGSEGDGREKERKGITGFYALEYAKLSNHWHFFHSLLGRKAKTKRWKEAVFASLSRRYFWWSMIR